MQLLTLWLMGCASSQQLTKLKLRALLGVSTPHFSKSVRIISPLPNGPICQRVLFVECRHAGGWAGQGCHASYCVSFFVSFKNLCISMWFLCVFEAERFWHCLSESVVYAGRITVFSFDAGRFQARRCSGAPVVSRDSTCFSKETLNLPELCSPINLYLEACLLIFCLRIELNCVWAEAVGCLTGCKHLSQIGWFSLLFVGILNLRFSALLVFPVFLEALTSICHHGAYGVWTRGALRLCHLLTRY